MQGFEQLPTGLWFTDRDGRILGANAMACALLGYAREDLLATTVQALTHRDDLEARQRDVVEGAPGAMFVRRRRMRHADGRWIVVEGRARLLDDGRVLTAIYDVTSLVEAETRAADREREYRTLFELAAGGKAQAGADGRIVRCNRMFCELTGYPESEVLDLRLQDLVFREDCARQDALVQAVVDGRRDDWTAETRYVRKDGAVRWFTIAGTALRDATGRFEHVVATFVDVTDRHQAVQQLRESEELYRSVSEAVPDILWVGGPRGTPQYANRRWSEYTGRPSEAVTSEGWRELVHPDDLARIDRLWSRAAASRDTFATELRYRRHDGAWRWFLARSVPMLDPAGAIVRWVGTLTDIDDRVLAEEALRDADRRKDEFLAVLSHELRNPLAPIRSGLEVLQRLEQVSERGRRAIGVISRQASHLTRLVEDLLEVTRITRGKVTLHPRVRDLGELVGRVAEDHRLVFDDRGILFTVRVPSAPLPANVDGVRIAQVVGNLLSNALKFTDRGGAVQLSLVDEPEGPVLRVADTGAGIAPELLDVVFQPFVQADTSLDRAKGGLGLGLALVEGMVALHGGSVAVRSEGLGRGAELVVRLPSLAASNASCGER